MADFCTQCGLELFGFNTKELAGISTLEDTKADRFANVICEGCGFTQVDHEGNCIATDCLQKHGTGKSA